MTIPLSDAEVYDGLHYGRVEEERKVESYRKERAESDSHVPLLLYREDVDADDASDDVRKEKRQSRHAGSGDESHENGDAEVSESDPAGREFVLGIVFRMRSPLSDKAEEGVPNDRERQPYVVPCDFEGVFEPFVPKAVGSHGDEELKVEERIHSERAESGVHSLLEERIAPENRLVVAEKRVAFGKED